MDAKSYFEPDKVLRVLLLEDNPLDAELEERALITGGLSVNTHRVDTQEAFTEALETFKPDICLLDYKPPSFDGALTLLRGTHPEIPAIMVTGAVGDEKAVELLKRGAKDYVLKDNLARLLPSVQNALEAEYHRRARGEAEQSRRLFRNLLDRSTDAVEILEPQSLRYLDCNETACTALGYTREELLTLSVMDVDVGGKLDDQSVAEIVQSGRPVLFESIHRRKDGSTFPVEVNLQYLVVDTSYLLAIVRDISERRAAEALLAERETWLRSIIEHLTELVVILDGDGNFRYVSPAARTLGGFEPDELIGRSYSTICHPDDLPASIERIKNLQGNPGQLAQGTMRVRHKNGEWRWVETVDQNLLSVPGVNGIVVTVRDVTERKHNEIALARASRALRTLSAGNSAVIHARNEMQLFQNMCDAAVIHGGYRTAWVGLVDDNEPQLIKLAAWGGETVDFLKSNRISWNDDEWEHSPTATCLRTGKPQICHDIGAESRVGQWRDAVLSSGIRSCISLPLRDGEHIVGALVIYAVEPDTFDAEESALLSELADDLSYGITALRISAEQEASDQRLKEAMEATVHAISSTVEMRDPYTAGHQHRVAQLCVAIGKELGLASERIRGLELAASIHDLGKISVPAEILSKPGSLTSIEYNLVQAHSLIGFNILDDVSFPWPIADMVGQHHERLDGSGYPNGLKGDQILLEARIIAVADVVEAMSSHRPYRAGLGIDAALEQISSERGSRLDPDVVDTCVRLFRDDAFTFD